MTTNTAFDRNPTLEFDDYCLGVLRRWETGELPLKEAVTLITHKAREAVADNHLANQGRAEHLLGYMQHYRGDLNASIRHYDRARALFQKVGNERRVATMDLNNGENYRLKGDFTRARRLYQSAYTTADRLGDIPLKTMAIVNEGLALQESGQKTAALKALREGLELTDQWTDRLDRLPGLRCEIHHGLSEIYLANNQISDAWTHARQTLTTARLSGEPKQIGYAYRALGEVVTMMDAIPADDDTMPTDPDEFFRLALHAFREVNMEAEVARTMFAQARSLATRGRRTMAARKLQQVMIMFSELGMVDDAAKAAEAQLAVI